MNPTNMLAQVKKMQAEMQRVQEELAATTVSASAGGGLVSVDMTCDNRVTAVKIDPKVVAPGEVETLEDLVIVAVNDALGRAAQESAKRMSAVTGGLRLPGM